MPVGPLLVDSWVEPGTCAADKGATSTSAMAEEPEVFHDVAMDAEDRPVQVHSLMKNQRLCTRLVLVEKTLAYPSKVRDRGA